MPRYIVEGAFSDSWEMPADAEIIERNADEGVTWLHGYVSVDNRRAFFVYDAPSPEAIRKSAPRLGVPIQQISQVRELSPYVYTPQEGKA